MKERDCQTAIPKILHTPGPNVEVGRIGDQRKNGEKPRIKATKCPSAEVARKDERERTGENHLKFDHGTILTVNNELTFALN